MAQQVSILLVDDIDESEAVETVKFGLDGTQYEIDLSTENAEELRALAALYVGKARRITGPARRQARTRNTANGADPMKIGEWARENGFEVSDRGRVPGDIVARYEAAVGA